MPRTVGLTKSLTPGKQSSVERPRGLTQDLFKSIRTDSYSCDFDGIDDYVNCATGTKIDFLATSGATLSYWVKFDSFSGGQEAIGVITSGKAFYLGIYSNWYVYGGMPNSGASYGYPFSSGASFVTGQWYHLVMTAGGGGSSEDIKVYVNADERGSYSYSPDASKKPLVNFLLGGANSASSGVTLANAIDGHVDEVAIWDEPLDADEIVSIYNSGSPTELRRRVGNYDSASNLWAYWRGGDTGSDHKTTTLTEQMGTGYDGTLVGGASFVLDSP